MIRCKGCGRELVTSAWTGRCAICGKKAGVVRASLGRQRYSRSGQRRAAEQTLVDEALASSSLTWQQAERLALDWMKKNGYRDATLTPRGADGGIDVISRRAVCQVKHHLKPVGLSEMQRIYGIAQSSKKKALFFSSAGYTPKARAWAEQHDIELFRFPPVRKEP